MKKILSLILAAATLLCAVFALGSCGQESDGLDAAYVKALEAIDGVENVIPSHKEKKATLTLTSPVSDETLKTTVEAQGYKVLGIE